MSAVRGSMVELEVRASLSVFGSEPSDARAWIIPRTDRWRLTGAAGWALGGLIVAPAVVLVPPHVPWALGAIGTGGLMAWKRTQERITLSRLEGECPRCGGPLAAQKPSRLRTPHIVSCGGCQHEATLTVSLPS